MEGLFRAYFTEGQDLSNRQNLIDVVVNGGLERQVVDAMLNSDQGMEVIAGALERSRQHGVSGVPFFIIDKQIAVSGAQQPETFLDAFQQAMNS